MEHFDIILALAKTVVDNSHSRGVFQIERLRDALDESDRAQSAKLSRLLKRDGRSQDLVPISLEEMSRMAAGARQQFSGEVLTKSTPLPHDKESGAPLARILFSDELVKEQPVLDATLHDAIRDLLSEWQRIEELARMGVKPHTRCLLFGPPGVGKTSLARHIASSLDLPCVEARLDGLMSSFLGTTARNIGSLFDFASRYRCVLFLDEFDAIAKARDDSHEIGEIKRVVNTLLQSLDARDGKGFTIAATNHHHLLDPAIWRRFEARISMPKPDPVSRERLIRHFLLPLVAPSSIIHFLVWLTEEMSGADIQTLIIGSKRHLALHGGAASPNAGSDLIPEFRGHDFFDAIRRLAHLNANLIQPHVRTLFENSPTTLPKILSTHGFSQLEIADIIGRSQSSISRRQQSNKS